MIDKNLLLISADVAALPLPPMDDHFMEELEKVDKAEAFRLGHAWGLLAATQHLIEAAKK